MRKGNIVIDLKDLKIKKTRKTPEVNFNGENGELIILGISIPENAVEFYTPAINWLKRYVKHPAKNTKLSFKLAYVNTSSLQTLYEMLFMLDELNKKTNSVIINWCYFFDDDDMRELGEDLEEALSISFNFCIVEDV